MLEKGVRLLMLSRVVLDKGLKAVVFGREGEVLAVLGLENSFVKSGLGDLVRDCFKSCEDLLGLSEGRIVKVLMHTNCVDSYICRFSVRFYVYKLDFTVSKG